MDSTEDHRLVKVFLDDDPQPFGEFKPPLKFIFDTTKIPDGKHTLKVVAKSTDGKEGIQFIPFTVRNGPAISVGGLSANDVVDEQIPITINAYGSERRDVFIVTGSETPKAIPAWVWVMVIVFIGWALWYFIMYTSPQDYKSFF